MSDTVTATRQPAEATRETITDSLGRTLVVRKLDALAELDLIEAVGAQNSANNRYMIMATLCATVREIDGVAVAYPADRAGVRIAMKRVGSEGIAAVMQHFAPETSTVIEGTAPDPQSDALATAKN